MKRPVRCNTSKPSPYLASHWQLLFRTGRLLTNAQPIHYAVDIGAGNGRNTKFLMEAGCIVTPLDAHDGCPRVIHVLLGYHELPVPSNNVDIILCQYVLMFLDLPQRKQLYGEIQRIAAHGCSIMVELYPAKASHAPTEAATAKLQREVVGALGWSIVHQAKNRFIARRATA